MAEAMGGTGIEPVAQRPAEEAGQAATAVQRSTVVGATPPHSCEIQRRGEALKLM